MVMATLTAKEVENPSTPLTTKPSPNTKAELVESFQLPKHRQTPEEFILSLASNVASQPLQHSDPDVWGVLTAISDRARKRRQGINMLLTSDEHCIGRLVGDVRFQILSNQISANHCKIYRKRIATKDAHETLNFCNSIYLKDTSTNGTYLNWEKLNKHSPGSKLHHGDIISFAAPPQHELAYAFVFRDVQKSTSLASGSHLKRKAGKELFSDEELGYESKRVRGTGVGPSKGPSLDDVTSLKIANMELRKQLENQAITIDSLRVEIREAIERHQTEKKDLKESISNSYLDKVKELNHILKAKQKELVDANIVSAEQKQKLEDVNQRLGASLHSCTEANDLIKSQKASISELKTLLNEEKDKRKEERKNALVDLKASIERIQAEAQEEFGRLSDCALKREKEQREIIIKLQESDKETCLLVENLRSKLEDTVMKLSFSENKVFQLEALVCEEKHTSANARKKVEELEKEVRRLRKELEEEKLAAREEARAKVRVLELEINAALKDLDFESRRFRAARKKNMLRETQLRALFSTTEEISTLFTNQQEQLKAIYKTLQDEENSRQVQLNVYPRPRSRNVDKSSVKGKETVGSQNLNIDKAKSRYQVEISTNEDSVTEKHECGTKNQENGKETQVESFQRVVNGAFGSVISGIDPTHVLEGDPGGNEQVSKTESPRNFGLNKVSSALGGDTMQLHEEQRSERSQGDSNTNLEICKGGPTLKRSNLSDFEVVGSWACSTAPSDRIVPDSQCGASDADRMRFNEQIGDDDDTTQEDTIES